MVTSLRIAPLLLCLMATQSGCLTLSALMGRSRSPTLDTSLLKAQGYSIPPGGMPSPVAPASDGIPRLILEVRGEERHLESIPLPTDRAIFVEELVQQAQLHEHFGNLQISIMRPNGEGAPPVRLDTRINDKGRATNVGTNYALLPNDHLIVISDQRSSFEKFVDKRFRK